MASLDSNVGAPDAIYTRRNWMPAHRADWTRDCFNTALEHGWVESRTIYSTRDKARQKARYLKDKIVQLELAESWQLIGHVSRREGGWIWSVEYIGERKQ